MQELHLLPGLLRQLLHIGDDLHLTVEHQQRIIEIGDAGDDVALHHRLVVLSSKELHLGTTLHREKIAEKIDIPAGRDGQRIALCGCSTVERLEGSLRTQGDRGQESQFGNLQSLVDHVDIEGSIQQVGIVVKSLLDERLQLRIGEHTAPRQITKRSGILYGEGIGHRHRIAHQSLRVYRRTIIFVIESAARQQQGCKRKY